MCRSTSCIHALHVTLQFSDTRVCHIPQMVHVMAILCLPLFTISERGLWDQFRCKCHQLVHIMYSINQGLKMFHDLCFQYSISDKLCILTLESQEIADFLTICYPGGGALGWEAVALPSKFLWSFILCRNRAELSKRDDEETPPCRCIKGRTGLAWSF